MRPTTPRLTIALLAALCLVVRAADDDFQPLIRGDDPNQFQLVQIGPETITIKDGVIRLSGKPNGYFATKDSYKNYVLQFEWMYERPEGLESDEAFRGNSGLLVHIQPPHKVWPKSIELQLMNRQVGRNIPIGGAKLVGKWDQEAYKRAIKPVGEWNREEVTSKDGTLTCTLNGVEVTRGTGAEPSEGQIGWQSEGAPIRFRNLRIKVLD
ncbi:MAG: DUF1080 domain-containing protein [Isosphaeraceae bacterium]|nr:DUF1080 domain-containing protein [Isosphaeraceae bacterium]